MRAENFHFSCLTFTLVHFNLDVNCSNRKLGVSFSQQVSLGLSAIFNVLLNAPNVFYCLVLSE